MREEKKTFLSQVQAYGNDKNAPLLIFSINPDDCFRCVNAVYDKLHDLSSGNTRQPVIVILKERRAIEKAELFETVLAGLDTTRVPVIFNNALYDSVQKQYAGPYGQSLLLLYDTAGNKKICKPVKEITGREPELEAVF